MRLTIFGASGRTGRRLVDQALDRGHEVIAFVRDVDSIDRTDHRLSVVEGDAYTGEGVPTAIEGTDAVLSALGQTSAGPDDLLTVAGGHILDAMNAHDVDRFVTLVGAGVRVEGETVSVTGRVIGGLLKLLSAEVLEDAEAHVEDVRSRDLAWTVVRVPRLSDDPPKGEYRTGDVAPGAAAVSRADVADFMLEVVTSNSHVHELPKIAY